MVQLGRQSWHLHGAGPACRAVLTSSPWTPQPAWPGQQLTPIPTWFVAWVSSFLSVVGKPSLHQERDSKLDRGEKDGGERGRKGLEG